MTIDEAIRRIEDLIGEFPDDIYVAALEEMEDRARSAREVREGDTDAEADGEADA